MDKSLTVVVCCFALTIASVFWSSNQANRDEEIPPLQQREAMKSFIEMVYFKTNPHRITIGLSNGVVLDGWADKQQTEDEIIIKHDDDSSTIIAIEDISYLRIHWEPPTLGDLS